jgi:hypothetical protein
VARTLTTLQAVMRATPKRLMAGHVYTVKGKSRRHGAQTQIRSIRIPCRRCPWVVLEIPTAAFACDKQAAALGSGHVHAE